MKGLRFTQEEYDAMVKRRGEGPAIVHQQPELPKPKPKKYRNTPVVVDGVRFDSILEYNRWRQLQILEKAGHITELRRQAVYILAPATVIDGRRRPAVRYIADFEYRDENGFRVVEDAKGIQTPQFKTKRHLMKTVLNIDVRIIQ